MPILGTTNDRVYDMPEAPIVSTRTSPYLLRGVVRESPHVAAVSAHHEDVGRRLTIAAARDFVLEPA